MQLATEPLFLEQASRKAAISQVSIGKALATHCNLAMRSQQIRHYRGAGASATGYKQILDLAHPLTAPD
jgi:hypothetical protein